MDLMVEVSEGVIDGSNVHNSARIEGSSGAEVPSLAKSVPSSLLHCVSGLRPALQLSLHRKDWRAALSLRSVYHELLWAILKFDLSVRHIFFPWCSFGDYGLNCGGFI